MSGRGRSDSLTLEQQRLAGLLVDTDLSYAQIASRLGVTVGAMRTRIDTLYLNLGVVGGRDGLRVLLLECELAAGEVA